VTSLQFDTQQLCLIAERRLESLTEPVGLALRRPPYNLFNYALCVEFGEHVTRLLNPTTQAFPLTLAPLALEVAQVSAHRAAVFLAFSLSITDCPNLLLS
jgi:hypothetical protein